MENVQIFPNMQTSYGCFFSKKIKLKNIKKYFNRICFPPLNLSCYFKRIIRGAVSPMKSTKELTHAVMDILTTHAGLVHDITDTDCQTQNGSGHGRAFASLERRFLTS